MFAYVKKICSHNYYYDALFIWEAHERKYLKRVTITIIFAPIESAYRGRGIGRCDLAWRERHCRKSFHFFPITKVVSCELLHYLKKNIYNSLFSFAKVSLFCISLK